jgi:uncharacterized membrane protein
MDITLETFRLVASVLVCIGVPILSMRLERKNKLFVWLNPIILCYAAGLISSLFLFQESNEQVLESIMNVAILLAISLHLLNTKLSSIKTYGKDLIIAYLICVLLAGFFSTILCISNQNKLAEYDILSGMLAGLYSGGNLNLSAVGKSLGGSNELITSALYADIFSGTLLILFLISLGPHFYGLFLKKGKTSEPSTIPKESKIESFFANPGSNLKGVLIGFSILLLSLIPLAIPGLDESNKTLATFLLISIISLGIGQTNFVKPSYQFERSGDFFLLIFCTCISLNVDLAELLKLSKDLLPILTILILCIMSSHILLCRLFNIDRNKTMVAFVAALYGVPFISQITNTLKAPSLLSGGIGLAVLGMAIGNIFGIAIAFITKYFAGFI